MRSITKLLAALLFCAPLGAMAAGAIAVDAEAGASDGYGFVTGASSRDEAGKEAMKECRKQGNKNCKLLVRFDECGAYAANNTHYGVGWGSSEGRAKSAALDQCAAKSCKVVVSGCE